MKSVQGLLLFLIGITAVLAAGNGYTMSPAVIPETGGHVTIQSQTAWDADATYTIVSSSGRKEASIVSVSGTEIVLNVGAYSGSATLEFNSESIPLSFTTPAVTASHHSFPTSVQFLPIRGHNFNPKNVHVTLTQTSPAGHRKRIVPATSTKHDCVIVEATSTEIVCAVMNLQAGSVTATVTTNGVVSKSAVVATISASADNHWTTFSGYSNGDCSAPNGAPDPFETNQCNCYSGYAPSTLEGTDCKVRAKCAELVQSDQATAGDNSPRRPKTSFSDDKLHIVQEVPIALRRHAFWTGFQAPKLNNTLPLTPAGTEGAQTCNYPGTLWNKTVSQLDCVDIYTADMPWVQNMFCGFVQDLDATTPEFAVYKTVLVNKYLEVYNIDDNKFQRLSKYSFLVTVQFATRRLVTSHESISVYMADSTAPGFVEVAMTSDAVYDVASGNVLVSFRTTAAWPYQLAINDASGNNGPVFAPTAANIAGVTVELTDIDTIAGLGCDNTQDSTCVQGWYARINTDGKCDIAGTYTFDSRTVCRDVNATADVTDCPTDFQSVSFSIRIKQTDLCAPEAISATERLSVELTPYMDQGLTDQTDAYQTGDRIYWRVDVMNPQATIERVEFDRIAIGVVGAAGDTTEDVVYEISRLTSVGTSAVLNVTNVDSEILAGETGHLYFTHILLRSALPNTVGQLDTTTTNVVLSTSITINLWYHGNEKRSLVLAPSSSITQFYKIQIQENPNKEHAPALTLDDSADFAGAASPVTQVALMFVLGFVALVQMF